MSARTVAVLAAELEVLDALADGPLSAREVSNRTYNKARQAWCDENGVEYHPDNCPPVVALLGWFTAVDRGIVPLHVWEVDRVLRRLERRGKAERIQVAGIRPMLWRAL